MRSNLVRALVLAVAAVWLLLLALGGTHVAATMFFRPFSAAAGVAVLLVEAFDRWLWRYLPPNVRPPHLLGTWRGELHSEWVDPKTGEQVPPAEIYMRVQQTYSWVRTRVMTANMQSPSLVSSLARDPDGSCTLVVTYLSNPKLQQRPENPIHYGSMMLRVIGTGPVALDGSYWTDRNTRGEIRFTSRCDRLCDDFEQARGQRFTLP